MLGILKNSQDLLLLIDFLQLHGLSSGIDSIGSFNGSVLSPLPATRHSYAHSHVVTCQAKTIAHNSAKACNATGCPYY